VASCVFSPSKIKYFNSNLYFSTFDDFFQEFLWVRKMFDEKWGSGAVEGWKETIGAQIFWQVSELRISQMTRIDAL